MLFPFLAFLSRQTGRQRSCDCRDNPLHTSFSSHSTLLKHLNCNGFSFKVWGIQSALVVTQFYTASPEFGVFVLSITPHSAVQPLCPADEHETLY